MISINSACKSMNATACYRKRAPMINRHQKYIFRAVVKMGLKFLYFDIIKPASDKMPSVSALIFVENMSYFLTTPGYENKSVIPVDMI